MDIKTLSMYTPIEYNLYTRFLFKRVRLMYSLLWYNKPERILKEAIAISITERGLKMIDM